MLGKNEIEAVGSANGADAAALVVAAPNLQGPAVVPAQPQVPAELGLEPVAEKDFRWGDVFSPLPKQILDKGFEAYGERNFTKLEAYAKAAKLGPAAYAFCNALNGIISIAENSTQANIVRTNAMSSYMQAHLAYCQKISDNLHVLSKMRANTRLELNRILERCFVAANDTIKDLTAALKEGGGMDRALFQETKKDIMDMYQQNVAFANKTLESLGSTKEDNDFIKEITTLNHSVTNVLTNAMNEMSKNDVTTFQNLSQGVKDIMQEGTKYLFSSNVPALANEANNNNQGAGAAQKLPKRRPAGDPVAVLDDKKIFQPYKATRDFAGDPEQGLLSYKTGDVLYVRKKAPKHSPNWFKAAKALEAGAPVGELGYVAPDNFKSLAK